MKTGLPSRAMVGEGGEKVEKEDGYLLDDDSAGVSTKNEQVIFEILFFFLSC